MPRERAARKPSPPERSARAGARPTRRAANREGEILAAAVDIFYDRGYATTSVEDVASAVGILKGSLYYYIDSKDDLLFRIVDAVHQDVQQIVDEVAARTDEPPLDRLADYVRRQVEYNARNLKRIAVYYHDFERLSDERLADIRKRRRQHEQFVTGLLGEAQERGDLAADLDLRLAAKCVFATIIWMYTWYRPGGNVSGKALGDFCARFVLDGVRGGVERG
jgi:AcrR family transcriptional regulator